MIAAYQLYWDKQTACYYYTAKVATVDTSELYHQSQSKYAWMLQIHQGNYHNKNKLQISKEDCLSSPITEYYRLLSQFSEQLFI